MAERKTTRSFSGEYPARTDIEAVIKADFYAPYAFIGTPPNGRKGLRKFFVLEKNSPARKAVHSILQSEALEAARHMETEAQIEKMRNSDGIKLGFQPISMTERLGGHKEFCSILGIKPYEYQLDGCVTGFPAKKRTRSIMPFKANESII